MGQGRDNLMNKLKSLTVDLIEPVRSPAACTTTVRPIQMKYVWSPIKINQKNYR